MSLPTFQPIASSSSSSSSSKLPQPSSLASDPGASSSKSTSSAIPIPSPFTFDPVEDAVAAIRRGEFVVIMDDESRENEGDLVCAASKVTAEGMAWMIRWTSGFICVSIPPSRLQSLNLPPLLPPSGVSQDPKGTAYHLTVDASSSIHPTTTGISAHDRSFTARLLSDEKAVEGEFTRPGHVVPLRYTPGGVRSRRGHTEAAVDLCYLAGEPPAGVLCELVNPDDISGTMAKRDDCYRFARQWGLKLISIEDLASYIEREGEGLVPGAGAHVVDGVKGAGAHVVEGVKGALGMNSGAGLTQPNGH